MDSADQPLPEGVLLRRLDLHADHRGAFAELFREEWPTGVAPVQWNLMRSTGGILRGVHVHPRHDDYLIQLEGQCLLGLRDLRSESPTSGMAVVVDLQGEEVPAITIPHGVAHGLWFPTGPSLQILGVSHYWDTDDELGCRWDDAELELDWSVSDPALSERDASLPPLSDLMSQLEPWQPIG